MADAMVTARMNPAKKQAGNRVLEELGSSASQAINQLYDHLIEERALPFECDQKEMPSPERIAEARAFIGALPRKNRFTDLTDDEAKRIRARERFGVNL